MPKATDDKWTPEALVSEVNKILKADVVALGNDPRWSSKVLPTGVLPIDYLLGGGIPRGRWTEVYGDFSTLKSYLAYRAIATTQADGGTAALVDSEHSYDPEWGEHLGIDNDTLIYHRPETGEEAVDLTELLVRYGVDLLVWDSLGAFVPQEEAGKREHGEKPSTARLASLMSRGLRKITAANTDTALLALNQTRISIGMTFGNPEKAMGGRAMPFYASHRLVMRKAGSVREDAKYHDGSSPVKGGKVTVVQKIKATLEKSKLTTPHGEVWFQFDLRAGAVDEPRWLVSASIEKGIITEASTGRYTYKVSRGKEHKWHGIERAVKAVKEDPSLQQALAASLGVLSPESPGQPAPAKKKVARRKAGS